MATNGGGGGSDLQHVVLFPWLAFGHLIPFLELAKRLAVRGRGHGVGAVVVTMLSTPRNVSRLAPVPPELSDRVRIVSLPLPEVDGLPDGAESTADVPPEKVELLKEAFDGLAAPFAGFLAEACAAGRDGGRGFSNKPDWIIVDFSHSWVPRIADQHEVPCAFFSIYSAAALAFLAPNPVNDAHPRTEPEDFMSPPPWIPSPSTLAYRRHEAEWIAAAHRPNSSGVSDIDRIWQVQNRCRIIIYRSCPEVEGQLCHLLAGLYRKPVVPAGLLLPSDPGDGGGDTRGTGAEDLMRWLDQQPERSVVYVALGSEAPLTADHVRELALGLELAGARFLWALRRQGGGELLPEGFEERVAGRGVVRAGWVPQVRVLAHGAVGAFLTHCGWGSTVESFRFGHPLVMLPFITDQGLIARAMADRGLGVEVPRGDDGSFGADGVAAAVRRVMAEEEGKVFARNARELQEALGDGARQERYVDELAECLRRRSSS